MRRVHQAILIIAISLALSGCFHTQTPGSAYKQFLSVSHPKMIVEIDSQTGEGPRTDAVNLLKQRIGERLNKPGGVVFEQRDISIQAQASWTASELRALERDHRDHDTSVGTAVMYILYVGGGYEKDSPDGKVLGVAYSPSSIAIFKDNVDSTRPLGPIPIFSSGDVEKAVLVHEFGHLLGLVNLGLPMQTPHEDTSDEHRGHSNNQGSVMYWAVESDYLSRIFNGPPPTQFDSNDIADMRAGGGK